MQDGQIIANRYEIIRIIGQGGMGDVFQGRDRQTGDLVAIKLLKPDIVAEMPDLLERFRREGEALRKLNHPNIVKMLDAVEENGLHYLVMQYGGGRSLRDLLDRHPQLPVDQVLAIGIELADAEQAYTDGIAADPTFTMLYALRSEVRARQGDVPGFAARFVGRRAQRSGGRLRAADGGGRHGRLEL